MCAKLWDRCARFPEPVSQGLMRRSADRATERAPAVRVSEMPDGESFGLPSEQLHLACGRIVGVARAIAEAHRFGVPEGPHNELWTAEYHDEAVHVYGESLPRSYQRVIASLFNLSADALAGMTIPARLAEDSLIVGGYLRNACAAILSWLEAGPGGWEAPEPADPPEIDDHTPMVVHFARLAALATHQGARRLERAAAAVQHHVGAPSMAPLDGGQRRLLQGVASGVPIVDLAEELGYSRSSMYRELSKLWKALGVPDRAHAIRKAAEEGLLD